MAAARWFHCEDCRRAISTDARPDGWVVAGISSFVRMASGAPAKALWCATCKGGHRFIRVTAPAAAAALMERWA